MSKNAQALKKLKNETDKKEKQDEEKEAILKQIIEKLSNPNVPTGVFRKIRVYADFEIGNAVELSIRGFPFCDCGDVILKQFQIKKPDSPNCGKYFWGCPKQQDDPTRCKFFRILSEKQEERFVHKRLEAEEVPALESAYTGEAPYTQQDF